MILCLFLCFDYLIMFIVCSEGYIHIIILYISTCKEFKSFIICVEINIILRIVLFSPHIDFAI